jgi:hypothetical protein
MTEQKRRLVDRILDPDYVGGLSDKPIEELREMRDDAREVETEMSFERRLCQARIDILTAELEGRAGGRDSGVIDRLPEILSQDGRSGEGPLPERAPDLSVPRNVDAPKRRVDEIAGEQALSRLGKMSDAEVRELVKTMGDYERNVSDRRKVAQEVMDTIQAEIVRRYVSGEADPSAALN